MRRNLWLLQPLAVLGAVLGTVTLLYSQGIVIPTTFVNGTTADANQVNANFTSLAANALNRNGGTMVGTLNSRVLLPTLDATYDMGSGAFRYKDFYGAGANITALNGSNVATGTVALTRLGTVACNWTSITKAISYSAVLCDLVETTAAGITITLPAASTATTTSSRIGLKNQAANAVIIARTGADTIDGAASFTTDGVQYESYDFVVNQAKTGWMIR